MFRVTLVWAVFLIGCHVALSKYSVEEAGLRVVFPSDYRRKMNMSMADFGKPRYGGTLRGQLVYPKDNPNQMMCAPAPCQYGCSPFNATFPRPWKINKEPGKFYIMMLDRGPRDVPELPNVTACLFLDKVYNAQMAGADAVLVANDQDDLTTAIAPEDDDTAKELESLSVSAAMISRNDAKFLKDLLSQNLTVSLQLEWSKVVPQARTVNWEYWTTSDDGCGAACHEQLNFMKAIKEQAQALERANLTKFTPRIYLWDCPVGELSSKECQRDCIANGTYCSLDRDKTTYTGQQMLEMDIRSLCFFNVSSAEGQSLLWWDYAIGVATNCTMKANAFTPDCASKVYDAVAGGILANTSKAAWDTCSKFDANATSFPILEENLKAMLGDESRNITAVSILPTIRINGGQYRGSLEAASVLRGICAGFRAGEEPKVCNADWISENDCKEGGVGYLACMSGEKAAANMTRCIDTFGGYICECKAGMQLYTDPFTGLDRCEDLNECLATNVALQQEKCKCDRCACVNKIGSYNCTGELVQMCNAEHNYGGCWHTNVNGTDYHACVDMISDFKALAARGERNESDLWYKCECPKCFQADKDHGCVPRCDLSVCDMVTGSCPSKDDKGKESGGSGSGDGKTASGGGDGGGGGGGSSKGSGSTAGFLILAALGSALLTGVIVMAANRYLMRQRMGDEIRDIMAQYMPLQAAAASAAPGRAPGARGPPRVIRPDEDSDEEGHVGAYGWPAARSAAPPAAGTPPAPAAPTLAAASNRGVWGPAPPTAAPKPPSGGSTVASPPAPAQSRPAVDVFTISGPDDSVGEAPGPSSAEARSAMSPSGASDPLLGLTVGSSTNLDDNKAAPAGGKPRRNTEGEDNPFL